MSKIIKNNQRKIRHRRIVSRIQGTAECPRLSVFRSNQHMYAQLVDDASGNILISVSDLKSKDKKPRVEMAQIIGKSIAKLAQEKGVSKVIFDRGGYKYHGAVKALAQAAREGGLTF